MLWQKFESWLNAKLARVNRECLTALLVACAVVAGVVLAVAIAAKVLSTVVLVLAALALIGIIGIWDRLRRRPV